MAKRDITGAVDFGYLETYSGNDFGLVEEVLGLFRQQASMWGPMLNPTEPGWRDAVHTIKGTARGIGAAHLANECERAETSGPGALPAVQQALDEALMDVAAYMHELALQSLKPSSRP